MKTCNHTNNDVVKTMDSIRWDENGKAIIVSGEWKLISHDEQAYEYSSMVFCIMPGLPGQPMWSRPASPAPGIWMDLYQGPGVKHHLVNRMVRYAKNRETHHDAYACHGLDGDCLQHQGRPGTLHWHEF